MNSSGVGKSIQNHSSLAAADHLILVVEDETSVLENILELLNAEGFRTASAHNGEEAYRIIPDVKPALIICDVRMPRLDGHGLLSRLSQTPTLSNIPFIFLTALTDRTDLRAAMELGADDYITKPFTRKDLLEAVFRRLEKHKQIQDVALQDVKSEQRNLSQAIPYEMLQPLTHILELTGRLEQMRSAGNGELVYQTALSIRSTTESLLRSVSNYLLLYEIEKPKQSIGLNDLSDAGEVDIKPVIEELCQSLFWEYGRQADLQMQIEPGPVIIREAILARMVEELIRNVLADTAAGQVLSLIGIACSDLGIYQFSIYGPKVMLREEQIAWLVRSEPLPLVEYMRIGMGFILAWKLAQASGSQLRLISPDEKRVCIELAVPLAARIEPEESNHV